MSESKEPVVDHEEWLADVMSSDISVTVGDPQTTGMFKKTTTYAVGDVRRRYSDFEWLYNVLCARYKALVVPAIPPKGGLTGGGEAFIKARIQGFKRFLARLALSPYLKGDSAVKHFLDAGYDGKKWDALKKQVTSEAAGNYADRSGIGQYRARANALAAGEAAGNEANDNAVMDSYARLAQVGSRAGKRAGSELVNLNARGAQADKATDDVAGKLAALADITTAAEGGGDLQDGLAGFAATMGAVNSAIQAFATHQVDGGELVAKKLFPVLNELNASLDEITQAFARLATLRKALASAESAKTSAAKALAKLEGQGKEDKGMKAHNLVKSTEAAVESLTQELAVSIRVLCAFELQRVALHAATRVARAVSSFASEMEAKENDLKQSWAAAALKLDDDVASTWNSTLVRLQLHGAEVDGTWLKDFDIATLADAGGDSL